MFSKEEEDKLPDEGTEEPHLTADYVQQLFDDGLKYEDDHFADTAHLRPILSYKDNQSYSLSPTEWRKACDMLAAGNLFEVIGRRNTTSKTKWMSENVEGLIPSNMNVRGSYISSNWHEITITPNIQYANDIFNQERMNKGVGWMDFVDGFREVAQKYGYADCRVNFYDDDEDGGHVCVQVIRPGDFAITPYAKWIDKNLGGTYACHGTMINHDQLKEYYPELVGEAQAGGQLSSMQKFSVQDTTRRGQYSHTKLYPRLELFIDDNTFEPRPFTEEEQLLLSDDLDKMTMGVGVPALEEQNHKIHIQAATEAIQNFMSTLDEETMQPEDMAFAQNVMNAFSQNIADHTAMMDENDPTTLGMQKKYPFGRYVCVVGGKLASDEPNPNVRQDGYGVPWRKLFHRVYSKKMYGRNDGVGDPETLFHDEKKASIALSRFEDSVVLATPKRYRNIQDKLQKGTQTEQEDNDPTAVGYYAATPPVSISGQISVESLKARQIAVEKAERAYGVNNVSIGGEPTKQSSGFQTQLLQKQNERIVTGDLDRNLRLTLQEVIEGMFEMYKVWYIGPRQYIIDGQYKPINVADAFSFMVVADPQTGEQKKVPFPKLQITIRPFSNFPNRFEVELGALVEIYNLKDEAGMPMIPSAAIKKYLGNKYPEAVSGEWDKLSQATQIGLQVMQQQQEAQAAQQQQAQDQQNTIDSVARGFERKNLQQQIMDNGNE